MANIIDIEGIKAAAGLIVIVAIPIYILHRREQYSSR